MDEQNSQEREERLRRRRELERQRRAGETAEQHDMTGKAERTVLSTSISKYFEC